MVHKLPADRVRRLRTRAQGLASPAGGADVAAVVQAGGGMQAQEAPAAALAVRARSTGADGSRGGGCAGDSALGGADLGDARHAAPGGDDDLGWLLPLLGPPFIQGNRRRRLELGLDDATCARAIPLLCAGWRRGDR